MSTKEIQLFEQSVAKLPDTASEVFAYVRDNLVAKTKGLAETIGQFTEVASTLHIEDADGMQNATEILRRKKGLEGNILEELALIKDKAHKLHKGVCAAIDVLQKPLDGTEKDVKQKMRTWQIAEDARLLKARQAAEEKARVEHERLIKAAQAKIDTAMEKIGDLDAKIAECERQLSAPDITQEDYNVVSAVLMGLADRKAGLVTKVQTLAAPPVPRAIPQAPEPEKIAGLSSKKTWTVEVVDMPRLIEAVHLRLVPTDVLEARLSILKKLANAGGVVTSRKPNGDPGIPGCVLTEDMSFTVRR